MGAGTIRAHDVTKSYGATTVVDRVSLTVGPGIRLGLIGPNGVGKSTLLRIVAGLERPDSGVVSRMPTELVVGYLPQELDARPGETLLAYLARRTGVGEAEAALDGLAARLGDEPELAGAYAVALDVFLALGGGNLEARARAVCADLRLGARLDRPLAVLSGGEAARARLAAVLLARFDILLLDEPTNDLDFEGLERLERFLGGLHGGLVVVSHDRVFLQRIVNRVLELEAETRRPRAYAGGFAEFERLRARRRANEEAAFEEYARERERFTELLHERRTDARAGGRQANRRATQGLGSKVRAAERRLELLERRGIEKPWRPWQLRLELAAPARAGDVVARLERAVIERGPFRLGPLDLDLGWGERLALVGPNGSGKTTLLEALLGKLPLAAGRRRLGPGARIGELDQERVLFATAEPLLTPFCAAAGLPEGSARTLLGRFGLRGQAAERPASSLSPGERTRAAVALLQALEVNVLVLDEPTNHLDLEAIEQLEQALAGFAGTVVLVTHDRLLLERFEPTRTIDLGLLD